jgi:hypothetical protein
LLVLPLLSVLSDSRISVSLLDIHAENIDALQKVISLLGISSNIKQIVHIDATTWKPAHDENFDLIISETMNTLLNREPQVTIFSHLQQFLTEGGVLIPEQINIGAVLETKSIEHSSSKANNIRKQEYNLGYFFQLNKHTASQINKSEKKCLSGEIKLPVINENQGLQSIKFTTDIDVYKTYKLGENACSLNSPIYYHNLKLQQGKAINFEYLLDNNPKFIFDFPTINLTTELPSSDDKGTLGIKHLKRFWKKSLLSINKQLDQNIHIKEWSKDSQLLTELELPIQETLAYLYNDQPDFESFELWVSQQKTQMLKS